MSRAASRSALVLDESKLPPKADAVKGIAWLPRLIPKAKAKLRGELPASLMYSCGGDRNFFKEHAIQSSEFLSLVWRPRTRRRGDRRLCRQAPCRQ